MLLDYGAATKGSRMSVDTFTGLLIPDRCLSRTWAAVKGYFDLGAWQCDLRQDHEGDHVADIFNGWLGRPLVFKDEDQISAEDRRSRGWPV